MKKMFKKCLRLHLDDIKVSTFRNTEPLEGKVKIAKIKKKTKYNSDIKGIEEFC